MQSSFETDRLWLHLLSIEDASFMQALVNTSGWLQFIGDRKVHSHDDAIAYINRILAMPNLSYWVVSTKEDNTSVGIISFLKRDYLEHFDIGFAFLPQQNGKGYAYEAAKAVLDYVLQTHEKVLATTIPTNTSSIKLLNKLGLRFDKEIILDEKPLLVYTTV
ncbi:MAG: GNAT family N-acetyltransferase [Chitinophagaceae bacterium]